MPLLVHTDGLESGWEGRAVAAAAAVCAVV
jgi:hypothetical protein